MVWITISELCKELDIARSTFDTWKLRGTTPRMVRLPNGTFRIRRTDFESWLDELVAA
jgi:predicted DNA-binding transcriptional regulator AlpA